MRSANSVNSSYSGKVHYFQRVKLQPLFINSIVCINVHPLFIGGSHWLQYGIYGSCMLCLITFGFAIPTLNLSIRLRSLLLT